MQLLFAQGGAWDVPWLDNIRAQVARLSRFDPAHTVFTRFIPPFTPSEAEGKWRDYYARWPQVTRRVLPSRQLELLPELAALTPPAFVIDKLVYSPWHDTTLSDLIHVTGTKRLIVSGGETEICVASAVLGAVDHGLEVILARDALCSAVDETHDAAMAIFTRRYGSHVTVVSVDEIIRESASMSDAG